MFTVCSFHRKWCFLLLLVTGTCYSYAQERSSFDMTAPTTVYKPSSTASELVKVTDIPVSTYSGTANISFPLAVIQSGALRHPITLNYTGGGGIPVDQEGNWVGLGWDLSVGGVITRSAMGKNDELVTTPGYTAAAKSTKLPLYTDANPGSWLNSLSTCNKKDIGEGRVDLSPDIYFLNFGGHTAKMFFDKNGQVFFSPFKTWRLAGNQTAGFTITTEDGNRYEFRNIEHSSTSSETYPGDAISVNAGNSAWFLTRIVSATLRDSITFNYTPLTYTYEDGLPSYTVYDLLPGQSNSPCSGGGFMDTHRESYTLNYQTLHTHVLNSITYNGGKIQLTRSSDRKDVNSGNKYRLMGLEIFTASYAGFTLYKKFLFNQQYTNATKSDPLSKRMLLSSFYETGGTDTLKYLFSYIDPETLPAKQSMSQDHWGYFNGKNNGTLIPAYDDNMGNVLAGANREPDSVYMQKGLLQTITYPTGGVATFDYEPHRYSYYNAQYQYLPRRTDSVMTDAALTANTNFIGTTTGKAADTVMIVVPDIVGQKTTITYFVKGKIAGDALAEVLVYDANWRLKAAAGDSRNQTLTMALTLNSGQRYYLIARRDLATEQARISVYYKKYNYMPAAPVYSKMAGGNRIKRITLFDGVSHRNDIVRRYQYMLNDSISSGILLDLPKYEDVTFTAYYCNVSTSEGGGQPYKTGDLSYFTRYSTSLNSLGRTQGSPVGYSKVSILSGERGENGREDFFYTITGLYDEGGNGYPYAPKSSKEDLRGLLLAHKIYNAAGTILKATMNEYALNNAGGNANFAWIWGAKIGIRKSDGYPTTICPEGSKWSFIGSMYKICQYWPILRSRTDSTYDNNGNVLVSKVSYQYDPYNLQVINETSTNSDQRVLSKTYKYPLDFRGIAVYDSMLARNIQHEKIETIVKRDNVQIYREKTNFGFFHTFIAPASKELIYGDDPMESRLQFVRYDTDAHLLEQAKTEDVPEVYLWGYRNEFPVARIVGATYGEVIKLVNASVLNNPVSDQALRDEINKIRTAFADNSTQVYTYTYSPQAGVTSETDPAGRVTYYQYDSFQRLATLKDVDGNIIKHFDYRYQHPVSQ
ncbi:RHS repeat domain-containing protein [Chitinophaga pinensis]|uniref:YD repeat protein n=1 Tax=Chitinophaga pinensis (strain ATCC 43595 / DSM 2588 / LMG 13176 / NBRC 15968 / NCIMB 11800 / UQM 2034) TaxID=485918 RepID=A0A979G6J5_CHIPD|nr:RHS repeat domain-containing protein [Chitinophaga pinensis]ACU61603.1 YD repeat protein [Chitinophaga pinensis DSM 2588]